jgi:hypothetical protein
MMWIFIMCEQISATLFNGITILVSYHKSCSDGSLMLLTHLHNTNEKCRDESGLPHVVLDQCSITEAQKNLLYKMR